MVRIKPVEMRTLGMKTIATLTAVKSELGALPNLFTTLANSSATLHGFMQFSEALSYGRLSDKQRELIAIAVAEENESNYCLCAHTVSAKDVGLNDTDINQARKGIALQDADAVIVEFALAVVRSRGVVTDDQFAAISEVCDNEGIIIEIVSNVVLNIMTNYINHLAGTEIDLPKVDLKNVV